MENLRVDKAVLHFKGSGRDKGEAIALLAQGDHLCSCRRTEWPVAPGTPWRLQSSLPGWELTRCLVTEAGAKLKGELVCPWQASREQIWSELDPVCFRVLDSGGLDAEPLRCK